VVGLIEGRPYALGSAPERAAAILASFFPGEEGASAISGVISGRVAPSGRLPLSVPASPDGQPATYLAAPLAQKSGTSNIDPTARYPFGHGLTYTSFAWDELRGDGQRASTAGVLSVGLRVTNTGARAGVELVQLYLHDPVASIVRPVNRLIGFARVPLDAGESVSVTFDVPADVVSFTGRSGERIVEPGALELRLGASSADLRLAAAVELTGETRVVDHTRALHCAVSIGR
jgi:beta-xylosidase